MTFRRGLINFATALSRDFQGGKASLSSTRVPSGILGRWSNSRDAGSGRLRHSEDTQIVNFRHHFSSRPHKDDRGVTHFRKRGLDAWQILEKKSDRAGYSLWQIRFAVGSVAVAGGALLIWSRVETVPYTNRRHVIFLSKAQEKALGEQGYEQMVQESKRDILPPFHRDVIRVTTIAADIIHSVLEGADIRQEDRFSKGGSSLNPTPAQGRAPSHKAAAGKAAEVAWLVGGEEDSDGQVAGAEGMGLSDPYAAQGTGGGGRKGERLDEEWRPIDVIKKDPESKEMGESRVGFRKSVDHLRNLKWEVAVIVDDTPNAACLPGGKIVVNSGLLKILEKDSQLATVLGHEVGHLVARHAAERMSFGFVLILAQVLISTIIDAPQLVAHMSSLLFSLPFSRMHELEADKIGLLLMARAGFDPRDAPEVYKIIEQGMKQPAWQEYISTHPSGKRRVQRLNDLQTMREAVEIYEAQLAGKATKDFL